MGLISSEFVAANRINASGTFGPQIKTPVRLLTIGTLGEDHLAYVYPSPDESQNGALPDIQDHAVHEAAVESGRLTSRMVRPIFNKTESVLDGKVDIGRGPRTVSRLPIQQLRVLT